MASNFDRTADYLPEGGAARHTVGEAARMTGEMLAFHRALAECTSLSSFESTYLERIHDFIPLPAAGYYILDEATSHVRIAAANGVSPYVMGRYEADGRAEDPILRYILETGEAADNWSVMSREEWLVHPLYRISQLQGIRTLLEVPAPCGPGQVATLYFGSPDDQPSPSPELRKWATTVAGVFGAAFAQMNAYLAFDNERRALLKALDLTNDAVVVTDALQGNRHVNAAARALLEQLGAAEPSITIDDMLVRESADGSNTASATVQLVDGTPAIVRSWSLMPEDAAARLTLLRLEGHRARLPALLREKLGPREQQVALLVVDGLINDEIARQLQISKHTAGQYVKSIYRKLGISSRVALAGLTHEPDSLD